jgi:hypothetical protein
MNAATYNTTTPRPEKFMNLVGGLQSDIKSFIKKEIELAKAEMGEKFSVMGRNAAFAAAGGVIGLMAVFMLLLGLGAIIARLLVNADFSPGAAYFIAYMGLAVVLGAVAYALIHKAMAAFSKLSLAPEKALTSAQAAEPVPIEIKRKIADVKIAPKPNSNQLQGEVIATRSRLDNELSELRARLTPAYMRKCFIGGLKNHPLPAIIVSLASTGLGGYLIYRKQQKLALVKKQTNGFRRWWNLNVRHA